MGPLSMGKRLADGGIEITGPEVDELERQLKNRRLYALVDGLQGTRWHPLAVWVENKMYRMTHKPPCPCVSWAMHDAVIVENRRVVAELKERWNLEADVNDFHKHTK